MAFDRHGIEILDEQECFSHLASSAIGRVSLSVDALPVVLPVNFVLAAGAILLRTGTGDKLSAAWDNAVVAFEIDDFDPVDHTGWSVMVQGRAEVVTALDEIYQALAEPLTPWANAHPDYFVRISCDRVSGRRIGGYRPYLGGGRQHR